MSKEFLKKFYAGILSLVILFCFFLPLTAALSAGDSEQDVEKEAAGLGLRGAGILTRMAAGVLGAKYSTAAAAPEVVAGRIIQGALIISGTIFGLLVIYGGYFWLQARGNEEYVKKAKDIIEAAVIGLVIIFGAYAFTTFIVSRVIEAAKYGG